MSNIHYSADTLLYLNVLKTQYHPSQPIKACCQDLDTHDTKAQKYLTTPTPTKTGNWIPIKAATSQPSTPQIKFEGMVTPAVNVL